MHPTTVLLTNNISIKITDTLDDLNFQELDKYAVYKLNYWFFKVSNNFLT